MNNNQFGMNSTNNQMNSNNFNQNGSFYQPQQPNNFGPNQNNQPNNFIQSYNQNTNNFNEQMPINQDNNSKKFNKISKIIIAVIAIIIIAPIVIILISKFVINKTYNDSKALTFVSNAKSYIIAAEALVNSDGVSNLFGNGESKYAPTCDSNNGETNIKLIDIITENYGTLDFAGPYGTYYDVNNSYVKVKAIYSKGLCDYEYYIYLTDGTYSIGTPSNPVFKDNLTTKSITK